MAIKTFKRNWAGSSTYICANCKHKTRNVGGDEAGCDLCLACYDEAGIENGHADGHHDKQADMSCYQCNPAIKTVIQQRKEDKEAAAEAESFNNPVSTITVKSQTARVVCKNTVPVLKKEQTMRIRNGKFSITVSKKTTVYQLRERATDYTILRLLCDKVRRADGSHPSPAEMIKSHGSAYGGAAAALRLIKSTLK